MWLICVGLSASSLAAPPPPSVLIFELTPNGKADVEMNLSMADYLATELDAQGKVVPIVYGMTDPIFRTAVEDGKLKRLPKRPTLKQGMEIANRLGSRYVMVYDFGAIKKGTSTSEATLFLQGRKIWSEPINFGVTLATGIDPVQAGQSIARTWVMHLGLGPFKTLVAQKAILTPVESAGQEPKPVDIDQTLKIDDNSILKSRVEKCIQADDMVRAVTLLRDAVDERPFDIDRRILLVQTLLDSHRSTEAGEEADRAVLLAPDRSEIRALAARAWMAAGKGDAARTALNEAIARDPSGQHTRLMLAELSLARLEPDKAKEHLDATIKEHPTRQAYYLRSLCRALLGDTEGVNADLTLARKLPETDKVSELQRNYSLAASAMDDALKAMGDETRVIMQRALARPDDVTPREKVADSLHLLQARLAFLTGYPVPSLYKGSNDRRGLAHSLFVQTMLAMQSYFNGGGTDAMTEARVDLGEALKEAAGARSAFATEQKPPPGG